jgi:hypothetical protein
MVAESMQQVKTFYLNKSVFWVFPLPVPEEPIHGIVESFTQDGIFSILWSDGVVTTVTVDELSNIPYLMEAVSEG